MRAESSPLSLSGVTMGRNKDNFMKGRCVISVSSLKEISFHSEAKHLKKKGAVLCEHLPKPELSWACSNFPFVSLEERTILCHGKHPQVSYS